MNEDIKRFVRLDQLKAKVHKRYKKDKDIYSNGRDVMAISDIQLKVTIVTFVENMREKGIDVNWDWLDSEILSLEQKIN